MKKLKSKGVYQLFILMILVSLLLTITSIVIIYNIVYNEKKLLLKELCETQKDVIQSIYEQTNNVNTVLDILHKQQEITKGLETTGEFAIGYLKNDTMFYFLKMKQKVLINHEPISLSSDKGVPMRFALSKNTGFIKGLDYKGNLVFSYCSYIPELKWGLVTKMDISELRSPFYKAGFYAIIISTILILIATIIFRKLSCPITKEIEENEENYRRLFEYSAIPIWKEDYSEIKKYFDKLKSSGTKDFRAYFESHKDEVNRLTSLIKVVEINQKSVEFFKAESKEDVIKNMLFYFNEKSLDVFREELIILAEGGKQFECEMPIRTLTGDIKILEMHLVVVKGYENTLSNVLVSLIDITERKINEEKLIRSREEWIETFDLIPDMITILDNKNKILRANKAATEKLGTSKQNILGSHCFQCVHGKQESPSYCPHALMQKDGKEHIADFYEENLGMDMLVSVTPIFDNNNNITGSIHIARDISDRKRMENELKQKNIELQEINATKDKFFKIIAHDLKNPFISLLGASELLHENAYKYNSDKIAKLTKILNDSAKSGYDMLLNMLEWSRSQAGSMIFQPEKINLIEQIHKNHQNLIEHACSKKINLSFEIAVDMQVYADKNMLDTILRNLVSNALKFTPTGGEVIVSSKKENSLVIISVKDTGVGIKESDFDKLFRTDIKFSNPGTEHEVGTGLGLLLCKEFVEKHGGKIWIESEVDKGSTFYFSLQNPS